MLSKTTNQLALLATPAPSRNERYFLALTILVFATLTQADAAMADESIPCDPEPTDMVISYGDAVSCSIDVVGDVDIFRFSGADGDVVTLLASRTAGFNPTPCIELFDPTGAPVDSDCNFNGARIDLTLGQTGVHSMLVSVNANNQTMGYTLSYQCILGVCFDLIIFADDFESGDTSAWSSSVP